MKAILIDVRYNVIKEVELNPFEKVLDEMYRLIGCNMVEVAMDILKDEKTNTVWVDEEGLLGLDQNSKFFTVEGGHQPFAGNGLILGADLRTGKSIDVSLTVEDVQRVVKFHTMNQIRQTL